MIHAGFARDLADGKTAPLEVAVDGTNSNTALIALGYVSQIVAGFQADAMAKAWPVASGAARPAISVTLNERPWFNEGLEDRWFFIPGVIGTLTLIQVISLTAFAVVREREVGTLEQIMVSPIRPFEFILGKTVPFFLIGLGDVLLVTTFRRAVVRHPVRRRPIGDVVGSVAVPAGGTRPGFAGFDAGEDSAAGVRVKLLPDQSVFHSFRLRVSDRRDAADASVVHAGEPAALLPGGYSLGVPERRRRGGVMAGHDGDGVARRRHARAERVAFPEVAGLSSNLIRRVQSV